MNAGYRDDPRWQAAREVLLTGSGGDPGTNFVCDIGASVIKFLIEVDYETPFGLTPAVLDCIAAGFGLDALLRVVPTGEAA